MRVKENTAVGEFNDAIYFTEAEFAAVSQQEIIDEAQKRIDQWVFGIQNPPVAIEPTKEQLLEQKVQLEAFVAELNSKIAKIDATPIAEEIIP